MKDRQLQKTLSALGVVFLFSTITGCGGSEGSNGSTSPSTNTETNTETNSETGTGPETGALTNAPQVTSTLPVIGSNGIALDTSISAEFSTNMLTSSIDTEQFTLKHGSTSVDANISTDGTVATLTPNDDLLPSTHYQATLNSGIVDNDGNALESYTWDFYTAGNGWAPRVMLDSPAAGNAEKPQVTFDAAGNAMVVWVQMDGSFTDVYAKRYDASSQNWDSTVLVETEDAGSATNPQISFTPAGDAIAVWQQNDGSTWNIRTNRYSSSDASWGSSELIEFTPGIAASPQLSISSDGTAHVVWNQLDGSVKNVYANSFNPTNNTWMGAENIDLQNINSSTGPNISTDNNGNAVAVWSHFNGTEWNIRSNRYTSGTWGTSEAVESIAGQAGAHDLFVDSDGMATTVWLQHNGSTNTIYSNQYSVENMSWGTVKTIETVNGVDLHSPKIAGDSDGNLHAVWSRDNSIYTSSLENNATDWADAVLIDSDTTSNSSSPQLAIDTDGNVQAVWYNSDGTNEAIYTNRFNTVSNSWGSAEGLATTTAGYGNNAVADMTPQLATDANGNSLAIWKQTNGSEFSIYSTAFNPLVIAP